MRLFQKFYDLDEWLLKKTDRLSEWLQTERGVPLPTILATSIWAAYVLFAVMLLNWTIQIDRAVFLVLGPITVLCWIPTGWDWYKRLDVYYKHAEQFDDENLRKMYSALALLNQQHFSLYRIFLCVMVCETLFIGLVATLAGTGPVNLPDSIFFASVALYVYLEASFPRMPRKSRKPVLATASSR